MRPGTVVVPQVFGQHLSQVALIDDKQPVEEFPAQGADDPFADRVALGAYGGLARILMPSPGEHGVEGDPQRRKAAARAAPMGSTPGTMSPPALI